MDNSAISDFLTRRDIRPTPNRILVMKALADAGSPVSLADLETSIGSIDKASIFRVLELLAEKDILHVISDGSRSLKYEICRASHHSASDQHIHFHCEKCDRVFCFENITVPHVDVPDSFSVRSVNFMLSGICPDCRRKPV